MKEIWKQIPGYEGYQVSDLGRVKSFKRHGIKILKPGVNNCGYRCVVLRKNGNQRSFNVGYLVLSAFVSLCPKGKETSHLNGDSLDNRLENLIWETHSQNELRKVQHGTDVRGGKNLNALLKKENVTKIKELIKKGLSNAQIGNMFNISRQAIYKIKLGITWSLP